MSFIFILFIIIELVQCLYMIQYILMQSPKKTDVRSSQVTRIIDDEEMAEFFLNYIQNLTIDNQNDKQQPKTQQPTAQQTIQIYYEQPQQKQTSPPQQKHAITKTDRQIQKQGLNFIAIYGEVSILLVDARLVGQKRQDAGKLLLTSYRIAFFSKQKRRVDVPFGFIQDIRLEKGTNAFIIELKYSHFWKFYISHNKDLSAMNQMSQLYLRTEKIKSFFAFCYALKAPVSHKFDHEFLMKQYLRLKINKIPSLKIIQNVDFSLCKTYPKYLVIPTEIQLMIKQIALYRNKQRFPVVSFVYTSSQRQTSLLWRSAQYSDIPKHAHIIHQNSFLVKLGAPSSLQIFRTGIKTNQKDQSQIVNKIKVQYLNHQSLQALRESYIQIVQVFLYPKKQFLKEVLNTKWYAYILNLLRSATVLSNKLLMGYNILLECEFGWDRTPQLTSLIQIIIDPYFRTFDGFATLVDKQFVHFGHPFARRLGHKNGVNQQFPVFVQFLDCVSQLISLNPMSFQYNQKFLSKLSNLMFTNIFGTFITDCALERMQNQVDDQTLPVWSQLQNQITINAFYQKKQGILEVKANMCTIRFWKQHFWYLTTALRDNYKVHPLAEDNLDYLNINCSRKKQQNELLKDHIGDQKKKIQELKLKIQQLKLKQGSDIQ